MLRAHQQSIAKSLGLGGLFALSLAALIQGWGSAASRTGKLPCTAANVAGSYAMMGSGTILTNASGLPTGALSSLGLITFDRQGRYQLKERVSFNGQLTDWTETGAYTVNPDCTCTAVADKGGASAFIIFASDRREALGLLTNAGTAINLTFKRVD
jgi:hypothetical protein